ncbi:MAG: hypothetical protein BWK80_53190, partial [Desulfobacteraceae bacterium IS3]
CKSPFPDNKLSGYFHKSLRDKKTPDSIPFPGNKLPGYFQSSLRDIVCPEGTSGNRPAIYRR